MVSRLLSERTSPRCRYQRGMNQIRRWIAKPSKISADLTRSAITDHRTLEKNVLYSSGSIKRLANLTMPRSSFYRQQLRVFFEVRQPGSARRRRMEPSGVCWCRRGFGRHYSASSRTLRCCVSYVTVRPRLF